jgi:Flp pilus assembly protein TadG
MKHTTARQPGPRDGTTRLPGRLRECLRDSLWDRLRRRGAATVELAICLPIIVLLTFGAIEMSNALFLKQALRTAAYEAARVATTEGQTEADARVRAKEVLDSRNIQDYTLQFSPAVTVTLARGTEVTVTVSAPASENSISPQWFFSGETLRSAVVMIRN